MSHQVEFPSHSYANPWVPGTFKRLPWLGLGALIGAVAALAASVAILVVSNGQPISSWTVQPSVYLAIAVPIVNLLLAFALAEGVDVAFWRKATSSGTTVADLHRVWHFGKSFKGAILAGRHTNLIAMGSVLVVAAQLNSPLLQRASKVVEAGSVSYTTVRLASSPNLPETFYTGYQSGRGGGIQGVALYTSSYLPVVNDWLSNTSYSIPHDHGCTGMCRTRMQGLGLSINCSSSSANFDLTPHVQTNGTYDIAQDPSVNGTDIFLAIVNDGYPAGAIAFRTLWKDTHDCKGVLRIQQCALNTATVEFPVVIDGNKSTITLDPATSIWDDNVLNVTTNAESDTIGPHPKLGILLALLNRYNSSAHMRWAGAVGYEIKTAGPTAQSYAQLQNTSGTDPSLSCSLGFRNPMDDIIAGARDLLFRTGLAVAQANSSFATIQHLQAQGTSNRAVFHSNYAYIGAAIAITLLTVIPVVMIFRGYSNFGRPCSMSPIAVAHAFDAPLLKAADSNLPVDKLIESIGGRSVKYGVVRVDNNIHAGASLTAYKEGPFISAQEFSEVFKLCMADEDVVREPFKGQTFAG